MMLDPAKTGLGYNAFNFLILVVLSRERFATLTHERILASRRQETSHSSRSLLERSFPPPRSKNPFTRKRVIPKKLEEFQF